MWQFLFGREAVNPDLMWRTSKGSGESLGLSDDTDGLVIGILFRKEFQSEFGAVERARTLVEMSPWIESDRADWVFDLDVLLDQSEDEFSSLRTLGWIRGKCRGKPEYLKGWHRVAGWTKEHISGLCFIFTRRMFESQPKPEKTGLSCDDRWSILKKLGEGGQGKVYLVRDATESGLEEGSRHDQVTLITAIREIAQGFQLDRREAIEDLIRTISDLRPDSSFRNLAALKVLRQEDDAPHLEGQEERIKRELDAMGKVSHPNIVNVLESNAEEKWFVSNYYPQGDLTRYRHRFAGDVASSLRAIRPLVSGVAKLHEANLVHRDIKPENIFIAPDNQLVLGDLGLVFFADEARSRPTRTLENVGSWDWMPEWAKGRRIEEIPPKFDLFSLGKVLWWLVAGKPVEQLRLWWFAEPEYHDMNVEMIHPDVPFIHLVNPLLAKCLTDKEQNCNLKNATDLLGEIDKRLSIIERNADILADDIKRNCKVCGVGSYTDAFNEPPYTTDYHNFGLAQPSGNRMWKACVCDHCGHVQLFHFNSQSRSKWPSAWRQD